MSQNSTTSLFRPINSDNGQNDSNNTPSSSRIDKKVASIKSLQSNADILATSIQVVDEVLETINRIIFNGKTCTVAKLSTLKQTLTNVRSNIQSNAAILSPIPAMGYANKRKQTQERRTVSPETTSTQAIQSFNNIRQYRVSE